MRVCVNKITGKMIESQSGDDGGLDVLIANSVAAGYAAAEIEASIVTDAQFQTLLAGTIIPPPVVAKAPTLVAAALNINVAASDITNIEGMFNIMGGAYAGAGTYMVFFSEPQPDTNYFAIITGNAPVKEMTIKQTDLFYIETMDAIGGAHVDPPQTSVQIYRIAK